MSKINTLKTLLVITIIFTLYDIIFLYLNMNLFNNQIEKIQGSSINIKKFSAILCYIALIFGLYYFIIKDKKSVLDAIILGLFVITDQSVLPPPPLPPITFSPNVLSIARVAGSYLSDKAPAVIWNGFVVKVGTVGVPVRLA